MHGYTLMVALNACLLLVAPGVIGKEVKEGDETSQANETEEREKPAHELRTGPEERPEGPARRDPSDHIDDHLRTQELLEKPVEIPERFEQEK